MRMCKNTVAIVAALALGLALGGCMTTGEAPRSALERGVPIELSAAQIAAVKAGARKKLKDPDSARFGERMGAVKDEKGAITVCGFVNAKNSYGGYTGEKPFTGLLSDKPLVFLPVAYGGTDADDYAVRKLCRDSGMQLP
jgi:hypothetical protein